jgi:hypothetical protein
MALKKSAKLSTARSPRATVRFSPAPGSSAAPVPASTATVVHGSARRQDAGRMTSSTRISNAPAVRTISGSR